MAKLVLRLAAVAAVTAVAGMLAGRFVTGDGQAIVLSLALFGSFVFFFAESLDSVTCQSHGMRAQASPAAAFRVLGIVLWAAATLCLLSWRG